MTFVSLTTQPEASVQQFVDQHAVPWSCGYGAQSTIARLGAFKRDSKIPGYEVMPTLFLIDADSTVRWCDGQARMLHGDPGPQLGNLEEQIERALTADERKATMP